MTHGTLVTHLIRITISRERRLNESGEFIAWQGQQTGLIHAVLLCCSSYCTPSAGQVRAFKALS